MAPDSDRGTVLVVEDFPELRSQIARALSAKGHRVLQAADGLEALEVLAADPAIQVVVSDIVMPRMNGVELAERLPASTRTRMLFISGFDQEAAALPGVVLMKPFSQAALIAEVEQLLEVPTTSS